LRKSTLRGLPIPGVAERLVVKLFADDTTVFLSEDDDYEDVQEICSTWCRASRARFNVEKTEILPIGTAEYRAGVIATRKLRPDASQISRGVNIVKDGASIRSLGAWIGNGANQSTPWRPILEKIKSNLEKWSRGRPSLNGRRLIVNMEVGGRSQFLTMAQGMPESICKSVVSTVARFVWGGDAHPRISREQL
ncbi:uncharacterized protein TRAVEDRAFT_83054, partial [Trametes versicolor FP-101664 SS1]|uniref:uncharacterized protein n=1 Tax=Trametes versicolor (strain FP-101664) TaxID=717944 RepID=UPI000462469D